MAQRTQDDAPGVDVARARAEVIAAAKLAGISNKKLRLAGVAVERKPSTKPKPPKPGRAATLDQIADVFLTHLQKSGWAVTLDDVQGESTLRVFARPRVVLMMLCCEIRPDMTLADIGAFFGGRHHSTVWHAAKSSGAIALRAAGERMRRAVDTTRAFFLARDRKRAR